MNRRQRRAAVARMAKSRSWEWVERPITPEVLEDYPAVRDIRAAFYNDLYSVQFYGVDTSLGTVMHMIVRGQRGQEPPWRDLQRIKDELAGPDFEAVQVYPAAGDVVDQADVYHLWLLPMDRRLPFGLHRENGLRRSDG